MYLVRDIFRCKPGNSSRLAQMFKQTAPSLEGADGFRNVRVMVDYVADYWTVVLHSEVEDLAQFERHMSSFSARPEIRKAMEGYMDLVEEGRREIYRIL